LKKKVKYNNLEVILLNKEHLQRLADEVTFSKTSTTL